MTGAKLPAIQFYVKDWLSDAPLQMASPVARAIWINALCHLWLADERGKITGTAHELARLFNASPDEFEEFLAEAGRTNFCGVSVDVTGRSRKITLVSRRIHREWKALQNNGLRQQRFRNNDARNAKVTPPSSSSSASSSSTATANKLISFLAKNDRTEETHPQRPPAPCPESESRADSPPRRGGAQDSPAARIEAERRSRQDELEAAVVRISEKLYGRLWMREPEARSFMPFMFKAAKAALSGTVHLDRILAAATEANLDFAAGKVKSRAAVFTANVSAMLAAAQSARQNQ